MIGFFVLQKTRRGNLEGEANENDRARKRIHM